MLGKLIISDLSGKRVIHLSLFLFIFLPALLLSNALSMVFSLSASLDLLFERSRIPHFVQMHAGEPDLTSIESWNRGRDDILDFQAVEMVTVDGSELFLSETGESEASSVMDVGFVRQNTRFDFLLDLKNEAVAPGDGEIAVPLFHKEKEGLEIGDTVTLKHGDTQLLFIIAAFTRDAQMNPALIHSKRFVVSEGDFDLLKKSFGESEYLLEYRLNDPNQAQPFADAYSDAGLSASGPAVTISLFRIINALSDGITITILILLSFLFCITAAICLRFTLLTSLDEDYREIGVMKGIGFPLRFIRKIYLGKYVLLGSSASFLGYIFSFLMHRAMTGHIRLYLGSGARDGAGYLLPLAGASFVFVIVLVSCLLVLSQIHRISAVQALRAGRLSTGSRGIRRLSLERFPLPGVNLTLASRDLILRGRMFLILGLVFFLCAFTILVPLNFLNTIESPEFISYMGIGRSDIRIDLRSDAAGQMRLDRIIASLEEDRDLGALVPVSTYRCRVRNAEGEDSRINVDTGDFSVFPLEYLEGRSPRAEGEISLSLLNAKELGVQTGDPLKIIEEDGIFEMKICGVYQDVTNGGYTAKALTLPSKGEALRHTLALDLRKGVSLGQKIQEYSEAFAPARVTDIDSYLKQTLGETIVLLRKITGLAIAAALTGSLLISSLFLRMILIKDGSQIVIMRALGFSRRDIGRQYLFRLLVVLGLGTIAGTLMANSAGQTLVSALWSLMGASRIRFVIDPVTAYVMVPAVLILLVVFTGMKIMKDDASIDSCSMADLNAE